MSLTPRAQAYLASFRRRSFVPVERVAEELRRAEVPVFDTWLDFHGRYAGYEEILGRDWAVWGILHANPYWLGPLEAVAEQQDSLWSVVCADVHPAYEYSLRSDGEFRSNGGGGRCESFDVKLERNSVVREAMTDGRAWRFSFDVPKAAGTADNLCRLVGAVPVPEASDKYQSTWRTPDMVLIAEMTPAKEGKRTFMWIEAKAEEAMLRQFGK